MADELERQPIIDPSTAAILDDAERRQAEARLPRDERARVIKAREKAKARLPRRVNWDLPVELKARIAALAEHHRVPASQVAAFLLVEGLGRLDAGEIDMEPYKTPSDSPRYDWNLTLPQTAEKG